MIAKSGNILKEVIANVDEATSITTSQALPVTMQHKSTGQKKWNTQRSNYKHIVIHQTDQQLSEAWATN